MKLFIHSQPSTVQPLKFGNKFTHTYCTYDYLLMLGRLLCHQKWNFNGCAIEVWDGYVISSHIWMGYNYLTMLGFKWMHVCKKGSCRHHIIVTSKRAQWRLKSPASRLFTQLFIQAPIKEDIKAPRHWPLWGEFTGDRWIPRTKGQ